MSHPFLVHEPPKVVILTLDDYKAHTGIGRYVHAIEQHLAPYQQTIEVQLKSPRLLGGVLSKRFSFLRRLPIGIEANDTLPAEGGGGRVGKTSLPKVYGIEGGRERGGRRIIHFPQIMGCAMMLWNPHRPAVATVHDLGVLELPQEWDDLDFIGRQILRLSFAGLKRMDYIVTVSEFTRQSVIHHLGVPAERVITVHSGIDHQSFRPIPSARQQLIAKYPALAACSGKWLLYVGSELPRKNLVTLLEALARLKESHSDLCLLKVGSAGLAHFGRQTKAAVKRLGLEGSVWNMGRVPDQDLPLFYAASDLFVHPSKLEGFGFPTLEAMACGTPVVCSNSTSLPEIAGHAARYFDPKRPDEMAAAIRRVLSDKELSATMREAGLARAATFTWQNTARGMLQLYQKLWHERGE